MSLYIILGLLAFFIVGIIVTLNSVRRESSAKKALKSKMEVAAEKTEEAVLNH